MSDKHGNTKPVLCSVCSQEIAAGTGLFVVEGDVVRFVHSGACAVQAGALPGGSSTVWGERSALASHLIANDGLPIAEAAEAVRWRELEKPVAGFAVFDLLIVAVQVLAAVMLWLAVIKIVGAQGGF